jgi:release factor glutamine methyltransferase
MSGVAGLLREAAGQLAAISDTARLDAELLLAHVLRKDRTWLFTWSDADVSEEAERQFSALLEARLAGKPVAWLLGEREFHGHVFRVTEDTLIPRPDTELLVEVVLAALPATELAVADLGTGTGAVGISLALARPAWRVTLTDIHENTLAVARDNARRLGADHIETRQSDWFVNLHARFDALVSNPPYIPENDPHLGEGDVRFESRRALVSGRDGLDAIRGIVRGAPAHLHAGGLLALEHGYDQGEAVRNLMTQAGFAAVRTDTDLGGNDRVTHGRLDAQR